MTITKAQLSKSIAALSASLLLGTTAFASVVYDNSDPASSLNRSYSPGNNIEFGDQVFLSGADRRITDFSFDYFLGANASGNETGELFFYSNDGGITGSEPGTVLYQSGSFSLGTGFQRIAAQALAVNVPNTFTWSVAFNGLDLGEQAGLLVFDPPTTGASFDDFWVKNTGGAWSTFTIDNGATAGNFSARITAVPEPSTVALAVIGGLALFAARFRRKSA